MSLYSKLLELQKAIEPITKTETNPFYKSQYFDINALLAALKPELNKLGLVVLQPLTNINGMTGIKTIVIDVESGEKLEDSTYLTETEDPQKLGSAITYFRRYSLQSLFALESQDDDANAAISVPVHQKASFTTSSSINANKPISGFTDATGGQCEVCKKPVDPKYKRCFFCRDLK